MSFRSACARNGPPAGLQAQLNSPGIGIDATHSYSGGSRMCRGEGQVQAGLLRRGLEVSRSGGGLVTSARISLLEGVLPSGFPAANYETWSSHQKTFVQWCLER